MADWQIITISICVISAGGCFGLWLASVRERQSYCTKKQIEIMEMKIAWQKRNATHECAVNETVIQLRKDLAAARQELANQERRVGAVEQAVKAIRGRA